MKKYVEPAACQKILVNQKEDNIISEYNPNRKQEIKFIYKRVNNFVPADIIKNYISSFIEAGYFSNILDDSYRMDESDMAIIQMIQEEFIGRSVKYIKKIIKELKESELKMKFLMTFEILINLSKNYEYTDNNVYTLKIKNVNNYKNIYKLTNFQIYFLIFIKLLDYDNLVLNR